MSGPLNTVNGNMRQQLETSASQCVQCAACVPTCPTYQVNHTESESPRGRVQLIKALAKGQLTATPRLLKHLDNCLGCGQCETVCPLSIPITHLIDTVKAQTHGSQIPRWLALFARYRAVQWVSQLLLFLQQQLKLPALGIAKLAPPVSYPRLWHRQYAATSNEKRGTVHLFLGCTAIFEQPLIEQSIALIGHLGFDVCILKKRACCGALFQHNGDVIQAAKLVSQNQRHAPAQTPLIFLNSGCARQLRRTLPGAISLFDWLTPWLASLPLHEVNARVLLHTPCTEHAAKAVLALLQQIPKLTIIPYRQAHCCGAGGLGILSPSATQTALAEQLLNQAVAQQADFILSTNRSCLINIQNAMTAQPKAIKTSHVLSWVCQHALTG